ncbi:hypothetical protein ACP70R_014606 [Stipagrostis hirtigluma subsp. patula]
MGELRVFPLLLSFWSLGFLFVITGEKRQLPLPPYLDPGSWNAAVVCAGSSNGACDHVDCRREPFLIVLCKKYVYVYSSENGSWSEPILAQHPPDFGVQCNALVRGALYFHVQANRSIIKFDLATREISSIELPPSVFFRRIALITTEDDGLGFAIVVTSKLHLWSREAGSDGCERWAQSRVIDLQTMLPVDVGSNST